MTTQKLPGTDAARHGTGDADLTIMLAAHQAFRRDLARLVRAAAAADLADPAKRQSVAAGWELFKRELHLHHTAEDELIWPALRPRLAHSENALSVLGTAPAARMPTPPWASSRRRCACSTGPSGSPASTRPRAGKPSRPGRRPLSAVSGAMTPETADKSPHADLTPAGSLARRLTA